jgi:hypothetical protein
MHDLPANFRTPRRVFVAAFSKSIGGKEAADMWVKMVDAVRQHLLRAQ